MSMNVYAKFRCAAPRIHKILGNFRELIPTRTGTTTLAFWVHPVRPSTTGDDVLANAVCLIPSKPRRPSTTLRRSILSDSLQYALRLYVTSCDFLRESTAINTTAKVSNSSTAAAVARCSLPWYAVDDDKRLLYIS